jgi:cytochrome d ubiquinol oxidase subunit I
VDDTLLLARAQFGLNIAFHILFPTITIGLAWLVAYFRIRTSARARKVTARLARHLQALGQGVRAHLRHGRGHGHHHELPVRHQLAGLHGGRGQHRRPLLAYEVLTAFFLEATFLGVMLFGMDRVSGRVHVASALIVAAGTTLSAFWILALNSWMQTPAGHVELDGELIAASWWAVIFNPSFPYRLTHMLLASGITAAFVVAGLSAWRLLKAPGDAAARKTLLSGARIAAVLLPLQIFVGDLHGLNTLEHQPAKIAALEAIWKTERGAALTLFGIPNERGEAHRLRDHGAQGRGADPRARCQRRAEGPRGLRGAPAGGAGVLRLPRRWWGWAC